MAEIPLRDVTGAVRAVALVDDEDYERINAHRWSLTRVGLGTRRSTYARRTSQVGGRRRAILMHREVMGAIHGDGLEVQHHNGDKLDNRKANLVVIPATPPYPATSGDAPHARTTVEVR